MKKLLIPILFLAAFFAITPAFADGEPQAIQQIQVKPIEQVLAYFQAESADAENGIDLNLPGKLVRDLYQEFKYNQMISKKMGALGQKAAAIGAEKSFLARLVSLLSEDTSLQVKSMKPIALPDLTNVLAGRETGIKTKQSGSALGQVKPVNRAPASSVIRGANAY